MKGSEVIASPIPEPVKIQVSGDTVYWTEGPGAIMYMKKDMLGAEKELTFTLEGFIAPSIEAEATLQGVAGKEVVYEITVKRPAAEPAYLSSAVTYTIEASVPANWTASADKKTITLSRGQAEKIKLTVKSALTALKGTYPVTLKAVSKQVSSEKTLYYEVIEYAVTGAAVSITPEKITKSQDEAGAVRYAVKLSNANPAETLPLTFYATVERPEGWLASISSQIVVAPQSYETLDLDVTPASPSDGLYKINVIFSTEKPMVSEAIAGITDMQVVTLAGTEYIYYNANGAIKRMYYVNISGTAGPTKQVKTIVYNNAKAFFVDSQYVYYIYEDSSTKEIRRMRNDGVGEAVTIARGLDNPVDIAVANYVYWTENAKGKIMRASKNQTNMLVNFNDSYAVADSPYAIYAANDIYWSETNGIMKCEERCSAPERVISAADVKGVFVSDVVYYTTYEKKGYGKLWKGTSLLAGGIENPTAVSVSDKTYFADPSGIKSISKAAFAIMGTAVYEISGLPAAKGCRNAPLMLQKDSQLIARPADTLRYGLTIKNRDEVGCALRTFFLTIETKSGWSAAIESVSTPVKLNASMSADAKLAVTSPSSASVGVYKTSLLASDALPKASPYYTTGTVKDIMFKDSYMYYNENNEITRSKDGKKEKIVGNRAGVIGRFVVDDAYVYWIETYGTPAVKSIYRIRNDGTGEIKTVANHLTDPRYVAVDSENVYWSDREQIKYISKTSSCDSSCSSYAEAADAKGVYSYGSLYWIDS
ncbi:MAG: hypothetical protein HZB66_02000, partial [Candidatus Aenigmarchaeota archaeon]|nr:hypothetical protein [Candidatus Aenigmarchaeota archaeon]